MAIGAVVREVAGRAAREVADRASKKWKDDKEDKPSKKKTQTPAQTQPQQPQSFWERQLSNLFGGGGGGSQQPQQQTAWGMTVGRDANGNYVYTAPNGTRYTTTWGPNDILRDGSGMDYYHPILQTAANTRDVGLYTHYLGSRLLTTPESDARYLSRNSPMGMDYTRRHLNPFEFNNVYNREVAGENIDWDKEAYANNYSPVPDYYRRLQDQEKQGEQPQTPQMPQFPFPMFPTMPTMPGYGYPQMPQYPMYPPTMPQMPQMPNYDQQMQQEQQRVLQQQMSMLQQQMLASANSGMDWGAIMPYLMPFIFGSMGGSGAGSNPYSYAGFGYGPGTGGYGMY